MTRVVIVQDYVAGYRREFFARLVERAAENHVDIVIAATRDEPGVPANGLGVARSSVLTVRGREFRMLGRRFTVRRLDEAISDADLVVLEQARRNLDAYRRVLARRPPLIALWGHGRDHTRDAGRLERSLLAWLTRRADWFFAYTRGSAAAAVRSGMPSERITVTQNSMETDRLRTRIETLPDDERQDYRRRHGLTARTTIFLGALDPSKRLDFVFEACSALAEADEEFRLIVAGDGPMRSEVEERAARVPWIRVMGRLDGDEKALALAASRAIVMPGRVGLVAVESFASGVPIVTTDWRLHAPEFEYLEPRVNAVVTRDQLAAYTAGLRSVLDDPALRDQLAAGCRRSAEVYTLDTMVTGFLAGVTSALKAGPR